MKSLKQNYDKHLVITVIVLVVLPILLSSSTFILTGFYQNQVITSSYQKFNDPEIGVQFLASLILPLSLLQYVILVVMLILYPLYPFIPSIENHLSKRNLKSALIEYQVLKKIVYALLPIFFFAVALRIYSDITQDKLLIEQQQLLYSGQTLESALFLSILPAVFLVLASASLRIVPLNRSKAFNFYQARQSFRALSRVEDDVERVKYLIEGLSFYNKYIRRTLRLQINDPKIIYSYIIADATVDKNRSMNELSQAFEDNDKLKPIRCLPRLFNITDPEHFLVKESVQNKTEHWIMIIGALGSAIGAFEVIRV
jgi:hypothetical protein